MIKGGDMSYIGADTWAQDISAENDRRNQAVIERAIADGRINEQAGEYLKTLYSDSIHWFREVFYVLGKCFGAPKATNSTSGFSSRNSAKIFCSCSASKYP